MALLPKVLEKGLFYLRLRNLKNFVTRCGTLRLRIARIRDVSLLPLGLRRFQRRAEEVLLLIGVSTR